MVFNNPVIDGVTIETLMVKPYPSRAGRGSFGLVRSWYEAFSLLSASLMVNDADSVC